MAIFNNSPKGRVYLRRKSLKLRMYALWGAVATLGSLALYLHLMDKEERNKESKTVAREFY